MEKNTPVSSSMKAMQKSIVDDYYSPSSSSCSSSFNSIYYTPPCLSQLSSPDQPFHTAISSLSNQIEIADQAEDSGTLLSKRLFFSPRKTSSIMEEREVPLVRRRHGKGKSLEDLPLLPLPAGPGPGTNSSACCSTTCFCKESVQMEIRSEEPYRDFRESMGGDGGCLWVETVLGVREVTLLLSPVKR